MPHTKVPTASSKQPGQILLYYAAASHATARTRLTFTAHRAIDARLLAHRAIGLFKLFVGTCHVLSIEGAPNRYVPGPGRVTTPRACFQKHEAQVPQRTSDSTSPSGHHILKPPVRGHPTRRARIAARSPRSSPSGNANGSDSPEQLYFAPQRDDSEREMPQDATSSLLHSSRCDGKEQRFN
jgi:hypothetical protein